VNDGKQTAHEKRSRRRSKHEEARSKTESEKSKRRQARASRDDDSSRVTVDDYENSV
jgi:hypothetical protein